MLIILIFLVLFLRNLYGISSRIKHKSCKKYAIELKKLNLAINANNFKNMHTRDSLRKKKKQ